MRGELGSLYLSWAIWSVIFCLPAGAMSALQHQRLPFPHLINVRSLLGCTDASMFLILLMVTRYWS